MDGSNLNQSFVRLAVSLVFAGCLVAFPSGCAWSVGGQKGGTTVLKPTRGQELIDLKKARETGAISDDEYEHLKRKLLD